MRYLSLLFIIVLPQLLYCQKPQDKKTSLIVGITTVGDLYWYKSRFQSSVGNNRNWSPAGNVGIKLGYQIDPKNALELFANNSTRSTTVSSPSLKFLDLLIRYKSQITALKEDQYTFFSIGIMPNVLLKSNDKVDKNQLGYWAAYLSAGITSQLNNGFSIEGEVFMKQFIGDQSTPLVSNQSGPLAGSIGAILSLNYSF